MQVVEIRTDQSFGEGHDAEDAVNLPATSLAYGTQINCRQFEILQPMATERELR